MDAFECPIPIKRLKVISTSSNEYSSENENWKLSDDFEELKYSNLIADEKFLSIDDDELKSVKEINYLNLINIRKKISDSLKLIYETKSQKSSLYICRCDEHLNKMIYKSHKARIEYVQTMTQNIQEYFPKWSNENEAIESVTWQMMDVDQSIVLKDVLDDIEDLKLWIMDTNRKMNLILVQGNWKVSLDIIRAIKDDIKVHDKIRNTINRVIEEIFEQSPDDNLDCSNESIQSMKRSLLNTEEQFFELWIQVMELEEQFNQVSFQCVIDIGETLPYSEEPSRGGSQLINNSNMAYGDCESGIETEFSPRFPWKRRHSSLLLPWNQQAGNRSINKDLLDTKIRYTNIAGFELTESLSEDVIPETEESMESMDPSYRVVTQLNCGIINKRKIIRRRRKRRKDVLNELNAVKYASKEFFSSTDENVDGKMDVNNTLRVVRSDNRNISSEHNYPPISPDISAALQRGVVGYTEVAEVTDQMIKSQYSGFIPTEDNINVETPLNDKQVGVVDDVIYDIERAGVIDIKQHWDYYEAPLYSHTDGGDSELLDVSEIREWEHELDDNSSDVISPIDSPWNDEDKEINGIQEIKSDVQNLNVDFEDNGGSSNSVDGRKDILTPQNKKVQQASLMMTSGYETSLEPCQNQMLLTDSRSDTNYLLTVILTSSTNQLNESTEALKLSPNSDVVIHSTISIANAHIQLIDTLVGQVTPRKEVNEESVSLKKGPDANITSKLDCLKANWTDVLNTCRVRLSDINTPIVQSTINPDKFLLESICDRTDEATKRCGWLIVRCDEGIVSKNHKCNGDQLDLWIQKLQLSQTMFKMCEKDLATIKNHENIESEIENVKQRILTSQQMICKLLKRINTVRVLIEESQEAQIEVFASNYEDETKRDKMLNVEYLKMRIKMELKSFGNANAQGDSADDNNCVLFQFLANCLHHELALLDRVIAESNIKTVGSANANSKPNHTVNSSQNSARFSSPIKFAIYAFAITAVVFGFMYHNTGSSQIFCRPSYINNKWLRLCYNSTVADDLPPH